MAYKVHLTYFRPLTGKLLPADARLRVERDRIEDIWDEINELRQLGRLPGLRVNAGRDLIVLVDVVDHPERRLHLIIPPFVDEEDVTAVRVPTEEMKPLVNLPMDAIPVSRTSTKDVLQNTDADDTPPDPIPILPRR